MTDETTLGEIFRRDPRDYSKQDIEAVVARMRQARTQFNLGAKQAGAPKKLTSVPSGLLEGLDV
jgi:hypothetical protein